MAKAIATVALIISVIALFSSIVAYRRAIIAVHERERQIIVHFNPALQRMYADFHLKLSERERQPHSVEDMLGPLVVGFSSASTQPAGGG